MLDFLKAIFQRLIADLNTNTYRYLYPKFNIDDHLTGIIGPRGVGKTQRAQETKVIRLLF